MFCWNHVILYITYCKAPFSMATFSMATNFAKRAKTLFCGNYFRGLTFQHGLPLNKYNSAVSMYYSSLSAATIANDGKQTSRLGNTSSHLEVVQ